VGLKNYFSSSSEIARHRRAIIPEFRKLSKIEFRTFQILKNQDFAKSKLQILRNRERRKLFRERSRQNRNEESRLDSRGSLQTWQGFAGSFYDSHVDGESPCCQPVLPACMPRPYASSFMKRLTLVSNWSDVCPYPQGESRTEVEQ
jgi:hypothetical protein